MIDLSNKIKTILEACDDKKGYNFSVIDISEVSSVCDYFILCSGNSDKQVQAIADEVEFKSKKEGNEVYHIEGLDTGRWVLIDMGDVIVHVFHRDERDIYNLEELWNEGKFINSEDYGVENWK